MDKILILDGIATRRIVLKAKLAPAGYAIVQAQCRAELAGLLRRERPGLVIVAADLPGGGAGAVCTRLAPRGAANASGAPPVIVIAQDCAATARCALLAAGAAEVLSPDVDHQLLLARIRSLIRAGASAEELRLREDTSQALGLAEAPGGFARRGSAVILGHARAHAQRWARALSAHSRASLGSAAMTDVFAGAQDPPGARATAVCAGDAVPGAADVYVLPLDPQNADRALRLIADLRARRTTRHCAVIAIAAAGDGAFAAAALDIGADEVMVHGFDPAELSLRIAAQIRRKQVQDRLRTTVRDGLRAALTDPLTGLFNRRYAIPHLDRMAARGGVGGGECAVLIADLDHFKQVNDRHGHAAGDAVLCEVARRLRGDLRAVDMVARIGGEEFLIALPRTTQARAKDTAERLRNGIGNAPFVLPDPVHRPGVTLSIGVAMGPGAAADLMARADGALYRAKKAGRNRVSLAAPLH